ncbi:GPR endopeptidase [Aliibacillus thermotolerans]|uniref:Germination protease n=1 Tax=Aliibacillus thermotolerans TaxID=1834418 RepID=A0ABW0UBQ5_9BACI|nr:GPR endopeptidase [Aliibacillus thermotolerans]MDA3130759.1 GPR endopeptidase [Aliibacillus thermotolerans]
MKKDLDLSAYSVRTDLALEQKELLEEKETSTLEGIFHKVKETNGVKVTFVTIDEKGAKQSGKKAGEYVTIEAIDMRKQDTEVQKKIEQVFAEEFAHLLEKLSIPKDATCLITGLGNWNVTPDALGPMVVEKLVVTRHLYEEAPEYVEEGFRSVSAFAPGVMGMTGVETGDIIHAIVKKIQPDFLIAIDALASRSLERLNATIQISDTGIHPGAGVGNKRKELSKETLGIPVIAVGIPTVVDAVSIVSDSIDYLLKHLGKEMSSQHQARHALFPTGIPFGERTVLTEKDLPDESEREAMMGMVGRLTEEEKRQLIYEVLTPIGHNLMVTPKEVDVFMRDMANIIAEGLNAALHEEINQDETGTYTK